MNSLSGKTVLITGAKKLWDISAQLVKFSAVR